MTLPTAPSRTMDQDTFDSTTDAFIGALPQFEIDMNALAAAMTLNATTDTSTSSVAIGTGAKTFTVSSGKSFWPGMWLVIADTAAPTTNAMFCQVTSYSGTSLVVNAYSFIGSGTKTAWQISQSAPATLDGLYGRTGYATVASATTPDIFGANVSVINYTGTATATGFVAAAYPTAVDLICAAACSFTFGANLTSPWFASGYTYTCLAGERVRVIATSTTTFRLETFPRTWSYTPIATNVTNADSSGVSAFEVSQVGNSVTVTNGQLSIDATASATLTQVDLSFPTEAPSNLTAAQNCTGFVFDAVSYAFAGGVIGNTANDRASVVITSVSTASRAHRISFTYVAK